MGNLDSIKSIIRHYIDSVDSSALECLDDDFLFGKMLRSKLILAIARESRESIAFCGVIELIHLASLLHDDVIDDSNMRRGKASINSKFGNKMAILLGDILYSKAFYEISLLNCSIASVVSDAVLKLSLGELEDVKLSSNFNFDKNKYLSMIEKKTASLIEASAYGASILLKKPNDKYKVYGKYLGMAYQIVDDLLDITKSVDELGKNSFSDFKEGKTTLPYIYLYDSLDLDSKDVLMSYFKKDLDNSQKKWILEKMREFNIISRVKEVVNTYARKATECLDSSDKELFDIVDSMIFRDY